METDFFDNDEIHHFEGKDHKEPCPACHSQHIKKTVLPPPILQSPFISKSPPGTMPLHTLEEQNKVKKFLNRFWNFCKHRDQITIIQYFVEKLTLEVTEDFMNDKQMKDYMINNITALYCVIMNTENSNGSKERSNEETNNEESDDSDLAKPEATSETPTAQTCENYIDVSLSLDTYIAEKETAHITKAWLHLMMDDIKKPKPKLKFLRAIDEAGVFTQKIPIDIYRSEFGKVSSSSYYEWYLGNEVRYKSDEITKIIEQYHIFMSQFPK